jgi:hypothetical protein
VCCLVTATIQGNYNDIRDINRASGVTLNAMWLKNGPPYFLKTTSFPGTERRFLIVICHTLIHSLTLIRHAILPRTGGLSSIHHSAQKDMQSAVPI